MIRALFLVIAIIHPTTLVAQTPSIGEMQGQLQKNLCPSNPQLVEECHSPKACPDHSDFFKWQACDQQCDRDYKVQSAYNRHVRDCQRAKTDREAKQREAESKRPPTGYATGTSKTDDFASKLAEQEKKASEASAKKAESDVRVGQFEKTTISARDKELAAERKDVADRAAADAANRAKVRQEAEAAEAERAKRRNAEAEKQQTRERYKDGILHCFGNSLDRCMRTCISDPQITRNCPDGCRDEMIVGGRYCYFTSR